MGALIEFSDSRYYDEFLRDYHRPHEVVGVNANDLQSYCREYERIKRELSVAKEQLGILSERLKHRDDGIKYILDLKV